MNQRDIAIRTILGEAANESPMGQAAVAHVLMNRARDPRWPATVGEVALQPQQFSAWNSGAGGNDLVRRYGPESDPYQRVGMIYDAVASGQISDPTSGATHYYSPAGMQALVDQGAQSNLLPNWLTQENQRRQVAPTTIGGHIFTGQATGTPQMGQSAGQGILPQAEPTREEALSGIGQALLAQDAPQAPIWLDKPQAALPAPVRRNTTDPYMSLFEAMRT